MLFDILFIADWKKIGEHRHWLTDLDTTRENEGRVDYDYKVGQKVLAWNDGILRKAEPRYLKDPWTLDDYVSPYKWNNHGSMQKQIRKGEYPESKTV
jgi:hypothetical protein